MTAYVNYLDTLYPVYVAQYACDNKELEKFLLANQESILCINDQCNPNLQLSYVQLAILQHAMDFASDKVDTYKLRESTRSNDRAVSKTLKEGESQRTNNGKSCSWRDSTGYQQFVRDSAYRARNRNDGYDDSLGNSRSYRWDRTRNNSSGCTQSFTDALATTQSDGFSNSTDERRSVSFGSSGTPHGLGPDFPMDVGSVNIGDVISVPTEEVCIDLGVFNGCLPWEMPSGMPVITPVWENDPAGNGFENPGPHFPFCGDDNEPCEPMETYGRGWAADYNMNFSAGFLNLGMSFGEGENFNQVFLCSATNSASNAESLSHAESLSTGNSNSVSTSTTRDTTSTDNDAHSRSDSESNRLAHSFSTSRAIGGSEGVSQSGNDSASHSENQTNYQGTASARETGSNRADGSSHRVSESSSYKWGQIFDSLNKMWKALLAEIQLNTRIFAASQPYATGCLTQRDTPMKCNPSANAFLIASNRPCKVC